MRDATDKKIAVVMALYHPNRAWLAEQLESLEQQSYPQIALWIADDGPDAPVGEDFLREHLARLPYHYAVHRQNLGSNRSYAALVEQAQGDYIAFCDQDDRWKPEKISALAAELAHAGTEAAYCSLCVMDGSGRPVAEDVRSVRAGDVFREGDNLAEKLFVKDCIYGCSLLIRAETAKEALPLPDGMGFDHWFTLWAALCGRIAFVDRPLVQYRIHGENQSKPLRGITGKQDYEQQRICRLQKQAQDCLPRFQAYGTAHPGKADGVCRVAEQALHWTEARRRWLHHDLLALPELIRGKDLSPRAFRFELVLPFMPNALVKKVLAGLGK